MNSNKQPVTMDTKDVAMEISIPPPSYGPNMTWRIKSFFNATPPAPSFAVPNDFDTTSQKGFKSNSWFHNNNGNNNTTTTNEEEKQKAIRRVASAPNAKLLNMTTPNYTNSSTISIPSLMTDSPPLQRLRRTCRRTYSSSSIKVKKVEVGPSSFVKIRMLGKGDVGKVYMVKQKETDKLFAMKGIKNIYFNNMIYIYIFKTFNVQFYQKEK